MTWLKNAKNFDVHRNLEAAKKRRQRAERRSSEAWAEYEQTGSMRELWRWDRYADKAQASLLGIAQAEALIRIAGNG